MIDNNDQINYEDLHNEEVDRRIGYAVEDGRLDSVRADEMSYSEKEDWLALHDRDHDPY